MNITPALLDRTFSVAPMMAWTDRFCRYFHRQLAPNALLYTEMITTGALIYGDTQRFLTHNPYEYPVAVQLGGSCPKDLATCALLVEKAGFQEVNLNVGCPSDRVQRGRIGACLMADPIEVACMVSAMKNAVNIPITVKHRIGISGKSSYNELVDFFGILASAGCDAFIVHAREAVLGGLSPKQNREIPPLKYEFVYQLKKNFPHENITINGGITSIAEITTHLEHVNGVMLGREAYKNPYRLAEINHKLFNPNEPLPSRHQIFKKMLDFIEVEHNKKTPVHQIIRHMLGLYKGMPMGKIFRRKLNSLSDNNHACINELSDIYAKYTE